MNWSRYLLYLLGMETLLHSPDQFLHHSGRDQVTATLAREFPGFSLDQLHMEPGEGRLVYPMPSWDQQDPLHPPYLAICFHDVLKLIDKMALLKAWNALNSLNVKYPAPEPQCSKASPALHLGIWETYLMSPPTLKINQLKLSPQWMFSCPSLENMSHRGY